MNLALVMLALRLQAALVPERHRVPQIEINWQETHAYRRGRRPHFFPAVRLYPSTSNPTRP